MSGPALFELVSEYRAAGAALAELDLDEQTLADTLESLTGDIEQKATQVAYVAMNLGTTAQAIRAHAKMQLDRATAIDNRCHALREYLARCMTDAGIQKIDGPGVKLSFRKSSAVIIDGADLIPEDLMRYKPPPAPEPDKTAIASAIKLGRDVPGAHIEHRSTLQIT